MNVRSTFLAALLTLGLAAGVVAAPPAQAATTYWAYSAATGGTYLKLNDGTVTSDLTAQSSVSGGPASASSKNSTAATSVASLANVGAIETKTDAVVASTGTTLKSWARTAHVNLLNGLITVDAVETNISTTLRPDGTTSHTANTQLAGIHIIGVDLPVNIPKNYAVTIPGVASVSLNYSAHGGSSGQAMTYGWAIGVTLLKARAGQPAGATLLVNPAIHSSLQAAPPTGATLLGGAYGTRVQVDAGDKIKVVSDPTAYIATPFASSGGKTLTNTTATVSIPSLLTTGAVTSTTWSTKDTSGNAEIRNSHKVAGLNVLNGLIRADAIEVVAAGKYQNGVWTSDLRMTTVNLVIAGRQLPINISPNTVIDVAGLGKVAINLQRGLRSSRQNRIDGIRITLDTARAGLPVGAVIEVGVAYTMIG